MNKALTILASSLFCATAASGATVILTTTDDGRTQVFGGNSVDTATTGIGVTQSGGLVGNGIFEFDLSSINDGATINSVNFEFTNTRFVSNLGSTAAVDLFAYTGDGSVTIADHAATGTQVADTSTPAGTPATGTGDILNFAFSTVAPLSAALVSNLLTVRFETDSFASFSVASLENTSFEAARLIVDFTDPIVVDPDPNPVPLPAGAPLALAGLGALALLRRRRKA